MRWTVWTSLSSQTHRSTLKIGDFAAEIKTLELGFSLVAKAPVSSICATSEKAELTFDNVAPKLSAGKVVPLS